MSQSIEIRPEGFDARAARRFIRELRRQSRPTGRRRPHWDRYRKRQKSRRSGFSMSLNLTPMIDLVFLLLFFFLVATQFGTREGMLPAQLPAGAAGAQVEIPRTPIRIRIQQDLAYPDLAVVRVDRFVESPIPPGQLVAELRKIKGLEAGFDADTPVHLLAGDDVAWDHVVNAYNAALAVHFQKIYFAGSP